MVDKYKLRLTTTNRAMVNINKPTILRNKAYKHGGKVKNCPGGRPRGCYTNKVDLCELRTVKIITITWWTSIT